MKRIPVLSSGSILKNLILLLCICFSANTVYSQYDPPITIKNSTSQRCLPQNEYPIVSGDYLVLIIENDFQINMLDFNVTLENSYSNSFEVEFLFGEDEYETTNDNVVILNPGSHTFGVYFENSIQPTKKNRIVGINVFIRNGFVPKGGLPKDYFGSGCMEIMDLTARLGFKGEKPISNTDMQNLQYDIEKTKSSSISGLILSDVIPKLRLEVENEKAPISIFLTNILNPNVNKVVLQNRYLTKGVYEMPLSNSQLPVGIYQLVIQQDKDIQRIKYFNSQ